MAGRPRSRSVWTSTRPTRERSPPHADGHDVVADLQGTYTRGEWIPEWGSGRASQLTLTHLVCKEPCVVGRRVSGSRGPNSVVN